MRARPKAESAPPRLAPGMAAGCAARAGRRGARTRRPATTRRRRAPILTRAAARLRMSAPAGALVDVLGVRRAGRLSLAAALVKMGALLLLVVAGLLVLAP